MDTLFKRVEFKNIVRHIIFSWLLAVTVEYSLLTNELRALGTLSGLKEMSLLRVIFITAFSFVVIFLLSLRWDLKKFQRYSILFLYSLLAVMSLIASFTWSYLALCILIFAGLLVYCRYGCEVEESEEKRIVKSKNQGKIFMWITVGIAAAMFLLVAVWTAFRVFSFRTPTYDFGLFAQMFHYMKETGMPLTTLERDGLLSHFNVHMSPIYYLMLPFYIAVPFPATIQVVQAAVVVSAVIPLWKICKIKNLPSWQAMLMSIVLLTIPAFMGGVSYDVHENCFLTPLILWLFYGIEKRNTLIISISALLTLCVKEDAAVYVAVIALWLIISSILRHKKHENKMLITGTVMLITALLWFFAVTAYLRNIGDGVMTGRYSNFMYDGSDSLITVIKAVLLNPMKAFFECVDVQKLEFIGLTLIPLLGLPLITRKYDRYVLLIPYILINLMSDYQYQHNIYFQYCFGSIAFLIYLTIINLADLKINALRASALVVSAGICMGCFGALIMPKPIRYIDKCISHHEKYEEMRDVLSDIPKDAAVGTTTFLTTYLSNRDILYDVKYCSFEHLLSCEYVVLGESYEKKDRIKEIILKHGYEVIDGVPKEFTVYKRAN